MLTPDGRRQERSKKSPKPEEIQQKQLEAKKLLHEQIRSAHLLKTSPKSQRKANDQPRPITPQQEVNKILASPSRPKTPTQLERPAEVLTNSEHNARQEIAGAPNNISRPKTPALEEGQKTPRPKTPVSMPIKVNAEAMQLSAAILNEGAKHQKLHEKSKKTQVPEPMVVKASEEHRKNISSTSARHETFNHTRMEGNQSVVTSELKSESHQMSQRVEEHILMSTSNQESSYHQSEQQVAQQQEHRETSTQNSMSASQTSNQFRQEATIEQDRESILRPQTPNLTINQEPFGHQSEQQTTTQLTMKDRCETSTHQAKMSANHTPQFRHDANSEQLREIIPRPKTPIAKEVESRATNVQESHSSIAENISRPKTPMPNKIVPNDVNHKEGVQIEKSQSRPVSENLLIQRVAGAIDALTQPETVDKSLEKAATLPRHHQYSDSRTDMIKPVGKLSVRYAH